MIFWSITGAFTAAVIYDRREKKRATAKWRRVVAPLAQEPIGAANQLPRKLTIYLEAPPGDGLRSAQDHFIEYAKPVLAASGLDWEFVQGRQQGDVRAAVAEKIRRTRRGHERPGEDAVKTEETIVEDMRKRMGCPDFEGVKGDVILGRHTWKEYVRGLHEGWLGSLDPPSKPFIEEETAAAAAAVVSAADSSDKANNNKEEDGSTSTEEKQAEEKEKEKEKEKKPERPPQPPPYNSVDDYSSAALPPQIPMEFHPSMALPFPHRLGFRHTFVRLGRFLNRRKLADDIGRDVAAACLAASRDWREVEGNQYEQQLVLQREESDWPNSVWKDEPAETDDDGKPKAEQPPPKEKIWASDMATDSRIMSRMRRFEITPEAVALARDTAVPEEEIEGWVKGSLRSMWRWGAASLQSAPKGPNVGNLDDNE